MGHQSAPRVRTGCGIPLASIAAQRLSMRVARSQEDNDRNLFLTKAVIDLTMQIIGPNGIGLRKTRPGKLKGNSINDIDTAPSGFLHEHY